MFFQRFISYVFAPSNPQLNYPSCYSYLDQQADLQAQDRAHRIGQKKVRYYCFES